MVNVICVLRGYDQFVQVIVECSVCNIVRPSRYIARKIAYLGLTTVYALHLTITNKLILLLDSILMKLESKKLEPSNYHLGLGTDGLR